jgi:Flp pilus assembly protein TadG
MTLTFGLLEFGLFFKNYLTVANTTRTAARVGSSVGKSADADYQILQAIKGAASALPSGANSIQAISVYKATAAGGDPPTACKSGPSAASFCNYYTASSLNLASTAFGGTSGKPDAYWPPTSRSVSQSAGTDYLGVWIKTTHGFVTKLFGTSRTISDTVVMRIEPVNS